MTQILEPYQRKDWQGYFIDGESTTGNPKKLLICAYQDMASLWICNDRKKGGWEIIISKSDAPKTLDSCHLSGSAPGSDGWGSGGVYREVDVESINDGLLLHIHDRGGERERILIDREHLRMALEGLDLL